MSGQQRSHSEIWASLGGVFRATDSSMDDSGGLGSAGALGRMAG